MYLNKLPAAQKENFLDLAILAAMANNEFVDEEKELIRQYCGEMNIPERYETKKSFEQVIDEMAAGCGRSELRMVAVEIYALLVSDKKFDAFETDFMGKIVEKAQITGDEYDTIKEMVDTLNYAYGKLNELIS